MASPTHSKIIHNFLLVLSCFDEGHVIDLERKQSSLEFTEDRHAGDAVQRSETTSQRSRHSESVTMSDKDDVLPSTSRYSQWSKRLDHSNQRISSLFSIIDQSKASAQNRVSDRSDPSPENNVDNDSPVSSQGLRSRYSTWQHAPDASKQKLDTIFSMMDADQSKDVTAFI